MEGEARRNPGWSATEPRQERQKLRLGRQEARLDGLERETDARSDRKTREAREGLEKQEMIETRESLRKRSRLERH